MSTKPFCVGDVTTNTIIERFAEVGDATRKALENVRDFMVFHESRAAQLGMVDALSPIDSFVRDVRAAIEKYDASGDHSRHVPGEKVDCIRCAVYRSLPTWAFSTKG